VLWQCERLTVLRSSCWTKVASNRLSTQSSMRPLSRTRSSATMPSSCPTTVSKGPRHCCHFRPDRSNNGIQFRRRKVRYRYYGTNGRSGRHRCNTYVSLLLGSSTPRQRVFTLIASSIIRSIRFVSDVTPSIWRDCGGLLKRF
jgi:hypothetical protein